jgi:cytochrome c oxidase subunit II
MRARCATLVVLALVVAGCDTVQSVTGGDGADSRIFNGLFGIFLAVCAVMYLLVVGFLGLALLRRRRQGNVAETGDQNADSAGMKTALIGWAVIVTSGLAVLTVASFIADRSMANARTPKALVIEISARQWWWDVTYRSGDAQQFLRTANELHLPVGIPAHVVLRSSDVIHSFWIPNLAGKQDVIPGRQIDAIIVPKNKGTYRGQCAEFCGTQHANMALDVMVESKEDFARWWAAQLRPAAAPTNPQAMAGYRYVTTRECSMCHNISGTPASGRVGPDLTHIASRKSLGAGALPMNRGNLYAWVADPQSQKPGNHMPTVGLEPQELHGVIAYLETLK